MDDQNLLKALTAVSPLDGRYERHLSGLKPYFSEAALIRYRLLVEARWLLYLNQNLSFGEKLSRSVCQKLEEWAGCPDGGTVVAHESVASAQGQHRSQGKSFELPFLHAAQKVKEFEQTTNHDVKAIEYFMREELAKVGATDKNLALIHFSATSEDINNLSYGMMLKNYRDHRLLPLVDEVIKSLATLAKKYRFDAMIARTHGQTATPTTMGKELAVFVHRILRQRKRIFEQGIEGKFNGAVGNFNAHIVAFPEVPWEEIAHRFVRDSMGLTYNPLTTQIENHDSLVELLEVVIHANTILLGLCRDIWSYISLGYFKQKVNHNEVGSSTMPHKVNPIDFENAEGNLGIASSLARHFCDKLPISRWQRDLSDSTVLRSLGVVFGHTELAYKSLIKGLHKIELDQERLKKDLNDSWEVLAEPLQTVLRKYGVCDAYERLKAATRGQRLSPSGYRELVESSLEIPEEERRRLSALTPEQYVGLAPQLAGHFEGILNILSTQEGPL